MSRPGQGRRAVPPGWDVIIDPEDELRHRVFNVTDEQLHDLARAVLYALEGDDLGDEG